MILAAAMASQMAVAGEYYVAAQGNDNNPGTLAKPFATLQRAQQAARKQRSEDRGQKSVTVLVRAGTYYLAEPLVFTSEDSGGKAVPVVYQAYGKEQPVLSGGMLLRNLTWQPYKDGIMMTKVPAGLAADQLFANGALQILARYLNFDPKARIFHGCAADAISPERAANWQDPTGGIIHTLHGNGWGGMHYRITGKGADNNVTYEGGWQNNRPSGMNKDARFVENNRRVTLRACHITRVGGNGVAFIGDPNACRNGIPWDKGNDLDKVDRTAGPKTPNYPADCVVDDCLIHDIGQVEKQTAGVTMDMAQGITVRHCSVYGLPDETGVLVMEVPTTSPAATAGLQKDDVIISCNDQPVRTVNDLEKHRAAAAGKKLSITLIRKQKQITLGI